MGTTEIRDTLERDESGLVLPSAEMSWEEYERELERRVSRGAQLLDEAHPGWEHDVNVMALNMRRTSGCVLGQVFGGMYAGAEILGFTEPDEILHGFDLEVDQDDRWWKALDHFWVKEIARRKMSEGEKP